MKSCRCASSFDLRGQHPLDRRIRIVCLGVGTGNWPRVSPLETAQQARVGCALDPPPSTVVWALWATVGPPVGAWRLEYVHSSGFRAESRARERSERYPFKSA
jgi:hypothetical protein